LKYISCDDLLNGQKKITNTGLYCPFCKSKYLRAWKIHFENPRPTTNGYNAMITLSNLYCTHQEKIYLRSTLIRPKNNQLHDDIPSRMYVDLFCIFCKHYSKLVASHGLQNSEIGAFIVDTKKRESKTKQVVDNLKIIENISKKRRPIPLGLRYKVLTRDKSTCQCCGAKACDGVQLHVDHIKPVSKGGTNILENLQTLCRDCNLGKSNKY